MSEDLEAGAPPAESGDVAPVEAAAVEAAPTDTEESAPVESTEPTEPSLSVEDEVVEDAPVSFSSADDFGWDEWAGDIEQLPDDVRPWGLSLDKYYQSRMQSATADIDQTREIYEALMGGKEDPRVSELQQSLTDWETKHTSLSAQHEAALKEYADYQKVVEEAIQQEAQEYADTFAETNQDLFENEELSEPFTELLEEGWILEHAAVAARLPQHLRDVARQAKSDGVPDSYALKLAQGAKSKPAKPRPGAALTSGATTPARSSEQISLPSNKPMSLREFRTQVARNALSNKRR